MNMEMQRLLLITGLGLALGSFMNVVIARLPEGWRAFFSSARSRCPACQETIPWYDNIPLLSFALLKGRCRSCQTSISWQYPLVEAVMAMVAAALFRHFGHSPYFYKYLTLMFLLITAGIIDLRARIVPDGLIMVGIGTGLFYSVYCLYPGWQQGLISLAVGLGLPLLVVCLYEALRGNVMFGGGDIKLLAMISLYIGWQRLGAMLVYSCLLAALVIGVRRCLGKKGPLPFAPAMAAGSGLVLWSPQWLSIFPL